MTFHGKIHSFSTGRSNDCPLESPMAFFPQGFIGFPREYPTMKKKTFNKKDQRLSMAGSDDFPRRFKRFFPRGFLGFPRKYTTNKKKKRLATGETNDFPRWTSALRKKMQRHSTRGFNDFSWKHLRIKNKKH